MAANSSNATVIEALVVTLGLDPKQYLKAKDDVERKNKQFRDSTKKQGDDLAKTLGDLAKSAATLFLGFESARAGLSWLAGLNVGSATLGRFSKNLGESVHSVEAWSNSVELAGGTAADAESDLQNLSNSITALRATGEVSPLLLLLQRMNVSLYDAQGSVRKLTDIYKDLGDKLQGYSRADAFNLARQAGLSESTFNLIEEETNARQRLLDLGEQNAKQNEASTQSAAEAQAQWRNLRKEIDNAGRDLNDEFMPAIQFILKFVASAALVIGNRIHAIGDFIGNFAAVVGALLKGNVRDAASIARDLINTDDARKKKEDADIARIWAGVGAPPGSTAGPPRAGATGLNVRNNNPGNIRYAGQNSAVGADARGFAIFPNLATGIREANRQLDLYASRGVNTIADIVSKWAPRSENDTASYIAAVAKQLGKGANDQLTAADRQRLLQAIFNQEANGKTSSTDIIGALSPAAGAAATARFAAAASSPNSTAGAPSAASGNTNVQIDQINVVTQATDADGIASDLAPALKRKGVVAQADSGMS